jgi:prevent-host-death family protein
MSTWQLQEAKAHFSELIRACTQKGPQMVSVHGVEQAVVLSKREYEHLKGKKLNFVEFINQSPLKGLDIDLERDQSLGREDIQL